MNGPTREQIIANNRAERITRHNAQCRENAARAGVQRNQEAAAATQQAVIEAGIHLRTLRDSQDADDAQDA